MLDDRELTSKPKFAQFSHNIIRYSFTFGANGDAHLVRNVKADDVDYIKSKAKLTFLDCWAPWCRPCHDLAPILEALEEKYSENANIAFYKINVDEYPHFGRENNIRGIPCVLVYFDGKPADIEDPSHPGGNRTDRLLGRRGANDYESVINQLLG